MAESLRITAASDFHGSLDLIEYVANTAIQFKSDLLLFPGDICGYGHDPYLSECLSYLRHLAEKIPIVLTPGNHDYWEPTLQGMIVPDTSDVDFSNMSLGTVICLIDQSIMFRGFRIYGSPWTPLFNDWNWMKPVAELTFDIPHNIHILLTHSPPYGMADYADGVRIGSEALERAVKKLPDLKLHVFGHNHTDAGWRFGRDSSSPIFANVAGCDNFLRPAIQGVLNVELTL